MARKLRSVKLDEISFVGKGDNPEAHVLLLKIKADPTESSILKAGKDSPSDEVLKVWVEANPSYFVKDDGEAVTFAEIAQDRELRDKIWSMCYMLEESLGSIVRDDSCTDKASKIQSSIDEFKAAVTAITKGENEMTPEEIAALKKAKEDADANIAELTKELDTLKACAADDKKKMDALEAAKLKKEADEEDVLKGLPEAIVKEIKENRDRISKMEDEASTREYVAKAAEVTLIGKADEVGDLLKSIAKHSTDLAGKVFGLFQTASARIAEGDLLKEAGKNTNDDSTGATAYDKIVAKAAELRKSHPELTEAKAFTKVYDEDTELRTAYLNERK